MNASRPCPDTDDFCALFDDRLSQEEERALQEHVAECDLCQLRLERMDRDDESIPAVSRHLRAAPMQVDTKLRNAMQIMGSQSTNGDGVDITENEVSLDFLSHSDEAESIGRLGRYEIYEVVKRGGMGIVLKGYDSQLKRVVAIKMLAPELASNANARKRFRREGQAAAAVSHDHVITIHGVDEANGLPHLVMEYIAGRSLEDRIKSDGPLELTEILRIGMQTAAGLAAAHAQGLVHRDIKPANILLENSVERVKITDFGLAHAVDDVRITKPGVVTGTPEYMSPEQARGEAVDHRSDLFSLGSVLYAMCTGRPPFRAANTMAMISRVCEDTPRAIAEINPQTPAWLTELIDGLLAKGSDLRFQSAAEVADLLSRYLAHVQQPKSVALPPGVGMPTRAGLSIGKTSSRRLRSWALVTVALLVLLTGLGLTEATGITDVTATIIRVVQGDGTLVIEVDDPNVSVSIDGEQLVITGAGVNEIRLPVGEHELSAVKDGKPVHTQMVTVSRNKKRVVKVSRDRTTPQPVVEDAAAQVAVRRVWAYPGDFQGSPSPSHDGRLWAYTDWETGDLAIREVATDKIRRITAKGTWAESSDYALHPTFAPDATQVAYTWYHHDTKVFQLRVVSLDDGEPRILFADVERPYIEPRSWSRDGSQILATMLRDKHATETQIVLISTQDKSLKTLKVLDRAPGMTNFSPDGKYIVYDYPPDAGSPQHDIYLLPLDGTSETTLVTHPANDRLFGWIPGDDRILFASDRSGASHAWVVTVANGDSQGEPQLVKTDVSQVSPIGFTKDGSFYYGIQFDNSEIHYFEFDPRAGKMTGDLTVASAGFPGNNRAPVWSSDGLRLAFTSNRAAQGSGHALCVFAPQTGKRQDFSLYGKLGGRTLRIGCWSPDANTVFAAGAGSEGNGIYEINVSNGNVKPCVIPSTADQLPVDPQISPDGRFLYFAMNGRDTARILKHDLNTGVDVEVHQTGGKIDYVRLSPDGTALVFTAHQEYGPDAFQWRVYSISSSGGQKQFLTQGLVMPAWSPDGQSLYYWRYSRDTNRRQLFRLSPAEDTGEEALEITARSSGHFISIHPDGQRIASSNYRMGLWEVWVMENFLPPSKKNP